VATAAELLLPLRPGLVPVPAGGQAGVCRFCHSACDPAYGQCFPCREAVRSVGAVQILPISMSVDGDLLHRHLRGYKDDRSGAVRARMSLRLAALLAVYMKYHRDCIGDFDSVVPVPSVNRTAVESILGRLPSLRDVSRPALAAMGTSPRGEVGKGRFAVTRDLRGERVLVVDDTFTTGATLFSAVGVLRDVGAEVVGPLVVGRHVLPSWDPSRHLLSWLLARPWDDRRCCRCDGERANPGQLL
jgi:predicted amidophosphoribosyltransferase